MAVTTNYGWTKPAVGGDSGSWGTELNTDLDSIDSTVFTVSGVASAALPKAGGVMTGRLDAKNGTMARTDKGSVSGAVSLDLSVAQSYTIIVGGAMTLSVANVPAGTVTQGILLWMQNAGSAAITWPAGTKFPGGSQPALTVSGVDVVALLSFDAGATWDFVLVSKGLS